MAGRAKNPGVLSRRLAAILKLANVMAFQCFALGHLLLTNQTQFAKALAELANQVAMLFRAFVFRRFVVWFRKPAKEPRTLSAIDAGIVLALAHHLDRMRTDVA